MNRIHNGIGRYTPIRTHLLFAAIWVLLMVAGVAAVLGVAL